MLNTVQLLVLASNQSDKRKKNGTSNKQANKERKIKLMQIGNKIDENGSP